MNRILVGIDKARDIVASKNFSPEKLAELSKKLDLELDEYCRFQTLKTAKVGTALTLDEAQSIYGFLGNTPEHFNNQPVEIKWVLTEVFASLLK
jgi:hypothetical protein